MLRRLLVSLAVTRCLGEVADFPKGLFTVEQLPDSEEDPVRSFVNRHIEPRHAVGVGVVPKGSKRHTLLAELAEDEDLKHLLALGAFFKKGRTSLSVYRHGYDPVIYEGKWTRSSIRNWLEDVSYSPVNRLQPHFAPTKYLMKNPFGVLLVVKPVEADTEDLAKALAPHALRLAKRLKITFFAKTPTTQKLCEMYGVQTSDEALLIEKPQEIVPKTKKNMHSHMPLSPKYRVENLSATNVDEFLASWEAGRLPRYLSSSSRSPKKPEDPLRELTGWDFIQVTQDPKVSVLVAFVSHSCEACDEFDEPYREVAKAVAERRSLQRRPSLSRVVVARIDQSENEHTELIKGTPWLRFFPRGAKKRAVDVELRSVESILDFLDEQELSFDENLDGEL